MRQFKSTLVLTVLLMLFTAGVVSAADDDPYDVSWYLERYPFMRVQSDMFSLESEFGFPEGFQRADSNEIGEYAFWVSHFPLWHKLRDVTSSMRGQVYEPEQISRTVHFPWRIQRTEDKTIPLQMLLEYYIYKDSVRNLTIYPREGDSLRYADFLSSTVVLKVGHGVELQPGEEREHSDRELARYLQTVNQHTTYGSLAANGDSVAAADIIPGDLFIAHNANGAEGRVWIVLGKAVNDAGDSRYVLATGCPRTCELHIPLFNDDRDNPWITAAEIEALGDEHEHSGFFRLRQVQPAK